MHVTDTHVTALECSFQDEMTLKITVPQTTMEVHRHGQVIIDNMGAPVAVRFDGQKVF